MGEVRLALFTDTYAPEINGVAKTLERWVGYLRKQGVACQVFAPARPRGEEAAAGVAERLASVPFFLYPECRIAMPASAGAERKLLDFRPTVVHVATPFGTGMTGRRLALKHGIPLVASHHTHFVRYLPFYNLQWMGKLLWRYLHWFHRPCRRIYVPSRSVLEECRKDGWRGLEVWSRAIDTSVFHPRVDRGALFAANGIPQDAFVALYAGRLAPEKQTEVAVHAAARFARETGADVRLALAGDGPQAPGIRALAAKLGLNAVFLGSVTQRELQPWMAASDALLFPSPTETFGNVALEAMACGLPVVAANAGALPDTVEDGASGLLCPPADPSAFADALIRLYREPGLRAALSERAIQEAQSRSWDDVFGRLLNGMAEASAEVPAVS
ncbi:glycosyltransferase family 4 protein [Cohnella nanjingensis]|uniref:Glycosyltransferase family 1 protein n=1 Tax=Cohnella nanjingensis TaxID=1387779 RepID=A0A7X0VE24_9BACL|nr:glycosyltransferase family 1 protein [Cohnella nanjingensis]MBB6669818.1 glycosyltransferase family 1 protein [Cohnella nanjingensis]